MSSLLLAGIDNILLGFAAFVFSFIAMIVVWTLLLRTLYSLLGKSKLYFIPKTLKELFLSAGFIFLLLSLAIAATFIDSSLFSGELFKIWEVMMIFSIVNILARVLLTGIDIQYKKIKDRSGIYRSIGLLKGTVGLVLYLIAMIISIHVLSSEVGSVVTVLLLFIVVLIFVSAFDQIKSIMAGLQLGDYYVDIGSLIRINGHEGFVESIHGRSTLLKSLTGKTIVLPNSMFFKTSFEIDPEEISEMTVSLKVDTKTNEKAKEKISALSSKVFIALDDVPREYKPKVFHNSVNDGLHSFLICFKITPASDLRNIMDQLCKELTAAFGEKLVSARLDG